MDRKPWELTDEELAAIYAVNHLNTSRAIATAAARKALEWAALQPGPYADGEDCPHCGTGAVIRKELSNV